MWLYLQYSWSYASFNVLPSSVISNFGGHFGGHIGFTGDILTWKWFLWLFMIGNRWKAICRHHKCDSLLILNAITAVFAYMSVMLGCHIGSHIGGHIGFTGDLYVGYYIWWLHCVGHGQKHIPRHQNCDSICNIHEVMLVLMFYRVVSLAILAAILAAILDLRVTY